MKIRSLEDWKLTLEGGECFFGRERGSRDLETDAEERRTIGAKIVAIEFVEFVDSYTVGGLIGLISHPITSIIPANVIFDFNVEYWPGRCCRSQLRMKRRNMIGLR